MNKKKLRIATIWNIDLICHLETQVFRPTSHCLSLTGHKALTLAHGAEPAHLSTLSASSKNSRGLSL